MKIKKENYTSEALEGNSFFVIVQIVHTKLKEHF